MSDNAHYVNFDNIVMGKAQGGAYQKALLAYLKTADKLDRMERALAILGPEAAYRGR